jgi:hypothetical protein
MPDIYDQHAKAFAGVSAYVIAKNGDQIGRVAFKFARSGLRTTCYFHVLGSEMTRAYASGGGYDKCSAAVHSAIGRIKVEEGDIRTSQRVGAIRDAVTDNGAAWDADLRRAGFDIWQAV